MNLPDCKISQRKKMPKFGTKNALLGYFWTEIWNVEFSPRGKTNCGIAMQFVGVKNLCVVIKELAKVVEGRRDKFSLNQALGFNFPQKHVPDLIQRRNVFLHIQLYVKFNINIYR